MDNFEDLDHISTTDCQQEVIYGPTIGIIADDSQYLLA